MRWLKRAPHLQLLLHSSAPPEDDGCHPRDSAENLVASVEREKAKAAGRAEPSRVEWMVIRFAFARSGERMDNCHQVAAPLSARASLPFACCLFRRRRFAEQSALARRDAARRCAVRIIDSRRAGKTIDQGERVPKSSLSRERAPENNISYCERFVLHPNLAPTAASTAAAEAEPAHNKLLSWPDKTFRGARVHLNSAQKAAAGQSPNGVAGLVFGAFLRPNIACSPRRPNPLLCGSLRARRVSRRTCARIVRASAPDPARPPHLSNPRAALLIRAESQSEGNSKEARAAPGARTRKNVSHFVRAGIIAHASAHTRRTAEPLERRRRWEDHLLWPPPWPPQLTAGRKEGGTEFLLAVRSSSRRLVVALPLAAFFATGPTPIVPPFTILDTSCPVTARRWADRWLTRARARINRPTTEAAAADRLRR